MIGERGEQALGPLCVIRAPLRARPTQPFPAPRGPPPPRGGNRLRATNARSDHSISPQR